MLKLIMIYLNKYFNKPPKPNIDTEYYYDDFDNYYPDNTI